MRTDPITPIVGTSVAVQMPCPDRSLIFHRQAPTQSSVMSRRLAAPGSARCDRRLYKKNDKKSQARDKRRYMSAFRLFLPIATRSKVTRAFRLSLNLAVSRFFHLGYRSGTFVFSSSDDKRIF